MRNWSRCLRLTWVVSIKRHAGNRLPSISNIFSQLFCFILASFFVSFLQVKRNGGYAALLRFGSFCLFLLGGGTPPPDPPDIRDSRTVCRNNWSACKHVGQGKNPAMLNKSYTRQPHTCHASRGSGNKIRNYIYRIFLFFIESTITLKPTHKNAKNPRSL